MLNLVKSILLLLILFSLIGCVGKSRNDEAVSFRKEMSPAITTLVIGEGESNLILLNEIQTGDIELAKELLEFSIDSHIISLAEAYKKSPNEVKIQISKLLLKFKGYRVSYPRKSLTFSALGDYNNDIKLARVKAEEILSQLEESGCLTNQ